MSGQVVHVQPGSSDARVAAGWLEETWPGLSFSRWLATGVPAAVGGIPLALGYRTAEGSLHGVGALLTNDMPDRPLWNPWLGCVYVEEEVRHRGIASAITDALVTVARRRGVRHLYLFCEPALVPLYASFGFEEIETRMFEGSLQVTMRSELQP